ncbi:MAG TPA: serine hydrolase domain-containing protein, partial [Emticicia sp.]
MKKHILRLLAGLLTCLFIPSVQAQPTTYSKEVQVKIKQVEQNLFSVKPGDKPDAPKPKWMLEQRMNQQGVYGLSIAVIKDYKIEWVKGYGWADVAEKRPVTTETLFQAASLSKSLNAVGVLKLVQNKKLRLDTDINNYLTTWKFPYDKKANGKKINIANLLSHSAGLTVHGFLGYERGSRLPTISEILDGKKPANSEPVRSSFEPGLKAEYSGGGTTISQLIVMDITKEPYAQYMWNNVLKPMGMLNSTYAQPPLNKKPNQLATGYKENKEEIRGKYHIYPEQAAAGLWTNPTDLAHYIIETQLSLAGKSDKVLSKEMTRLRLSPFVDKDLGLGVFLGQKGSTKTFGHG